MAFDRNVRVEGLSLYFLPVKTRIPLKFGPETTTHATCARVRVEVSSRLGARAEMADQPVNQVTTPGQGLSILHFRVADGDKGQGGPSHGRDSLPV
jgi:hypothetical protein